MRPLSERRHHHDKSHPTLLFTDMGPSSTDCGASVGQVPHYAGRPTAPGGPQTGSAAQVVDQSTPTSILAGWAALRACPRAALRGDQDLVVGRAHRNRLLYVGHVACLPIARCTSWWPSTTRACSSAHRPIGPGWSEQAWR